MVSLQGCVLSAIMTPTTTTEVGRSGDGAARLVLTEQLEESFPDDMVTYSLELLRGSEHQTIHAGHVQAQALSRPQVAAVGGSLTWSILDDLCALQDGVVRCASFTGLDNTYYPEDQSGCCRGADNVQCSCGMPRPDPALRAAYHWALSHDADWRVARGATAALVMLSDPDAPALTRALRRRFPSDPLSEALEAAVDPGAHHALVETLPQRSLGDRLLMAKACVSTLEAPLRASVATEAADRRARLESFLKQCP